MKIFSHNSLFYFIYFLASFIVGRAIGGLFNFEVGHNYLNYLGFGLVLVTGISLVSILLAGVLQKRKLPKDSEWRFTILSINIALIITGGLVIYFYEY